VRSALYTEVCARGDSDHETFPVKIPSQIFALSISKFPREKAH